MRRLGLDGGRLGSQDGPRWAPEGSPGCLVKFWNGPGGPGSAPKMGQGGAQDARHAKYEVWGRFPW